MSYKQSYMLVAVLVIALAAVTVSAEDCDGCKELVRMGKGMAPAFAPQLKQYCYYLGDTRRIGTCTKMVDHAVSRLTQATPQVVCQLLTMCPGGKWVQTN